MSSSLHNHSMYSPLDGYSNPKEYLDRAKEIGLKAFTITEHGNQYSWVYFDELKKDYPEIKIQYGVELYECDNINIKDKNNKYYHLIAICKNEKGRIGLNEIVTKSNFEGFYYKPRIDLELLKPYANDLIICSACLASKLARETDYNICVNYVNKYKSIFPNYYLEMQSHSTEQQKAYNKKILQLSKDTNIKFVITTDSHAAKKEDLYFQGRLVQIAHDSDTISESYTDCYLQSDQEIHDIMDEQIGYDNVCIGLKNTDYISDLIEEVNMPFQQPQLPTYPLPDNYYSNYEYLRHLTDIGWKKRNFNKLSEYEQKIRKERLEYELKIIHQMKYDGYFLIVWDFVSYVKKTKITAVGDGRGSGGGSIVNYLLGISELDPIEYDLIFERFLNPERISMPDIDMDFADRDKVIEYLVNKYGEDRVCQIINYSYITPVVAIKDVGRILKIPYDITDKISKLFVYETFDECLNKNEKILKDYSQYKELFDIASKLSGRLRQVSVHAGGVGIVDTKITNYMGMKLGSKCEHVIQVDKRKIEEIGIIKFDLLGVATLNIVKDVTNELNIGIDEINNKYLNDEKTYQLLQSAKTNGVFQVESQGMKDLLIRLQPNSLEDVSAILALYRPDSMPMLEDYIFYKHNTDKIKYWHKDMEPLLKKTYGCIIYQEEIMDIVRVFGGRTYGGADKFRKGIGKKSQKLVQEESQKLYNEIIENGYEEKLSKKISDYFSKMGSYSFNKSHSALYAILTLKTAYLKANYPIYFFKSLLNLNNDNYGSLNKYIIDATNNFNICIMPPNINKSEKNFSVYNNNILFGLQAIKGIGEEFVNLILNERNNGLFKDFNDFANRVNPSVAQVVILIKAGAIPCKDKRKFLISYFKSLYVTKKYEPVKTLPVLKTLKEKWCINTDIIKGKEERLFLYNKKREIEFKNNQQQKYIDTMNDYSQKYMRNEQLWEFEALSVFITDNPFKKAYNYILPFEEIQDGTKGVIVGVVSDIIKKKDKNKNQYAFINLYSTFGIIDIVCWSSQYKVYQQYIQKGISLAVKIKKDENKATVQSIKPYDMWLNEFQLSHAIK